MSEKKYVRSVAMTGVYFPMGMRHEILSVGDSERECLLLDRRDEDEVSDDDRWTR